jgi:hypothetical protein
LHTPHKEGGTIGAASHWSKVASAVNDVALPRLLFGDEPRAEDRLVAAVKAGLPGVTEMLPFLDAMTWVDFPKDVPDPLEQLIWGVTGGGDG